MTREEAINEIRSWDFLGEKEIEALETLIPELKESEDERIRKKIVSAMSYYRNDGCISEYEFGVCRNWLEKQKAAETPQWMIDFLNDIRTASINKEGYDDYDGRREYEGKILAIIRWLEGNFIQQKEQKPEEWSEEDELMRKRCIADLGYLTEYEPQYKKRYDEQIDWLKSLRPCWKPTEEQKPETKLTRWVARDENGEIYAFEDYPEKDSEMWIGSNSMILDRKSFPDLKWENEPMEVEITIRKK